MQDKHCLTCLELEKCTFYVQDLGSKPSEVQLSTYSCYKYNPKQTEIKLESLTVMNLKPDDILIYKIEPSLADSGRVEFIEQLIKDKGIKNEIIFMSKHDDISAIRAEKAAG